MAFILVTSSCQSLIAIHSIENYRMAGPEAVELGSLPLKTVNTKGYYDPKRNYLNASGYIVDARTGEAIPWGYVIKVNSSQRDTLSMIGAEGDFQFNTTYEMGDTILFEVRSYIPATYQVNCIPLDELQIK